MAETEIKAFKEYVDDVKTGRFPTDDHCYHILEDRTDEYYKILKEYE